MPRFIIRPSLFFLLGIFLTSITFAADFHAKVIHIADGDTITVLNDTNEQIKIRLNGIDCPEKAQAYGNKAKLFTKDLVAGQTVTVQAYCLWISGAGTRTSSLVPKSLKWLAEVLK